MVGRWCTECMLLWKGWLTWALSAMEIRTLATTKGKHHTRATGGEGGEEILEHRNIRIAGDFLGFYESYVHVFSIPLSSTDFTTNVKGRKIEEGMKEKHL